MIAALDHTAAALLNHAARANWLAFDNPLHNAALALHSLGHAALCTAFLHVFHGFGFDRFG